jgi:exodeoxyribonuclease V alpha subunit
MIGTRGLPFVAPPRVVQAVRAMDRRSRKFAPPPKELLARTQFEGRIVDFTYKAEEGDFAVARFEVPEGRFTLRGNLFGIGKGELVRVEGEWREHQDYGIALQVKSVMPLQAPPEASLASYLGGGILRGIGPAWAQRIVDHFGAETIDVLDHAAERLMEVPGMTRARAEGAAASWLERREQHEIMLLLRSLDIPNGVARRLVRHYGNDAGRILKADPFRVALEVPLIGFLSADDVARRLGVPRDSPQRVLAGLVHALSRAQDNGHTYLDRATLIDEAVTLLDLPREMVEEGVASAVQSRIVTLEILPDGTEAYFAPAMHRMESMVAHHVARLRRGAEPLVPPEAVDPAVDQFQERYRFDLAPAQRAAIRAALAGGIVVVTGGPGTGKTTLVRALLHVLKPYDVRVALCSPTGRAAQRLSEATHEAAATIHRLLRFNAQTGEFGHNAGEPLDIGMLLVDEASMVDIPLASALLAAVPDGATVVFVGDIDQLPSVGPGAFLKDLIASGAARTVRLDVVFRQAAKSLIIANSHRIHRGEFPRLEPPEDAEAPDFFFIRRDEPEGVREALIEMVSRRIPQKFGLDPIDDVQVLTPMRRGVLGSQELNTALRAALHPEPRPLLPGTGIGIGDKVIQGSNNYELEVFNGDVGRVQSHDRETGTVSIAFGRRVVQYGYDSLDQLQPAYAITIHKSQGSEYPAVVVPVHTTHFIMLQRNLLYTAVTRGKRLVVLIGSHRALAVAVKNDTPLARKTALRQWLLRPPDAQEGQGALRV